MFFCACRWNGGTDSQGECGLPTSVRFRMPQSNATASTVAGISSGDWLATASALRGSSTTTGIRSAPSATAAVSYPTNGVFWYSFEVASVHIIMLSSEHDPTPPSASITNSDGHSATAAEVDGSPMGQWLAADLAAVDKSVTPWVIVGIHRPLYETEAYEGDYTVAQHFQALLEPLLLQYGVDVVVAGHYHSFMRTCSLVNYTCVNGSSATAEQPSPSSPSAGASNSGSRGIIHYTTGAAGMSLDNAPLYPSDYIEKYDGNHFGYSIFTVHNSSAMRMQWFWNQDNSLQDDVWVYH